MKNPADAKPVFSFFSKLSRSHRTLVAALAIILLPTCAGLAYLLTNFWVTTQSRNREFVSAMTRDTLVLSGYDQSVRLFYIAQEAFTIPSHRDSLHRVFEEKVTILHGVGATYVDLLSELPGSRKELLVGNFARLWLMFDDLVDKSEKVFSTPLVATSRANTVWVHHQRRESRRTSASPMSTSGPCANISIRP